MPDPAVTRGSLLARNTVLNLVGLGLPLLIALVAIPFVVRGLGADRFGILALTWVVLGYFGIFDLGLGRAATKYVAEALRTGDEASVPAITWTALVVQIALGGIGALVLVAVTPLLVERVLKIPEHLVGESRLAFHILAFSLPAVLATESLRGVLEAAQRFDLVNAARVPFAAGNFLLPLVGVLVGWDLPGIVLLLVLSRGLGLLVHYALCLRVFPALAGLPRWDAARLRSLISFGGWVTVSSVISPILLYLDRVMIGVLLSMGAVAYYTAPYEMVVRLGIIPASLVATLFPEFSALHRGGAQGRVSTLFTRSIRYILLVLGPIVAIIVAFAHDILRLWLGTEFASQATLPMQILAVGVLVNSLGWVPLSLVQAVGRPDITAKFHLAEVPVQVLLVWLLVNAWGIAGAALAWSLRITLDAVLRFLAATRLSSSPSRAFVVEKVPHVAGLIGAFGLLATIVAALGHLGWLRIVLVLVMLFVVAVVVWRHLLDDADRARVLALLNAAGA